MRFHLSLAVASLLLISGCDEASVDSNTKELVIAPALQLQLNSDAEHGAQWQLCYPLQQEPAQDPQCQGEIEDFSFEWGKRRRILVEVIDEPESGEFGQYRFIRDQEIELEPLAQVYNYPRVVMGEQSLVKKAGEYYFFGQPIDCPDEHLCRGLANLEATQTVVDLEFELVGESRIALTDWR
ncbi:hypothetical protein [Paraferrimonas sedimenticola]|uniref:Lipoprotein n=1 Tax=Paraferrimonas sedimenticola TaxID=375674 RepID=A0AA37RYD2_9GAMM|nr:hypothetical protein [Paraferrimonas sedimenticola]GLP97578.1 hypothetical protein GCM10007895_28850 [Paraferrimonas sedimenticola]